LTLWTYETSRDSSATAATVFVLFEDVASWPEWNAGVERIDLDGPFASGALGIMTMPDGERLAFRLVSVANGEGFEDETPIAGAGVVVRVRHILQPLPAGGIRITYAATVDGPGAGTAGPGIGSAVTADFPAVLASLVAFAEAPRPARRAG
jgi:hypothetical protein